MKPKTHRKDLAIRRLRPGDDALFHGMLDLFAEVFDDAESYSTARPGQAYRSALLARDDVVMLVALDDQTLAGALVAPVLSVDTGMGESVLILTFVVVVIGGIGSIKGAFLGALLVAVVDTLGGVFGPILLREVLDPSTASQVGRVLAPMLVYILMAVILFAKPAGLFGSRA